MHQQQQQRHFACNNTFCAACLSAVAVPGLSAWLYLLVTRFLQAAMIALWHIGHLYLWHRGRLHLLAFHHQRHLHIVAFWSYRRLQLVLHGLNACPQGARTKTQIGTRLQGRLYLNNNNNNLQASQLIVLARYLLGVPKSSPVSQHALT